MADTVVHVTAMKRSMITFVILCNIFLFVFAATFIEEQPASKEDLNFPRNADDNTQMFILFTQQRSGCAPRFLFSNIFVCLTATEKLCFDDNVASDLDM